MAKQPKQKRDPEAATRQVRGQQLGQVTRVVDQAREELAHYREQRRTLILLTSVADGLYEEVDKVSKKAPAEEVTKLVYEEANQVIKDAKQLTTGDPYMQRLKEFVAAGEHPPYRDVVVALKLLLQGLERFRAQLEVSENQVGGRLREARGVQAALEYFLEADIVPSRDKLRDSGAPVDADWLDSYYRFNFDRLDSMNIEAYFSAGQEPE